MPAPQAPAPRRAAVRRRLAAVAAVVTAAAALAAGPAAAGPTAAHRCSSPDGTDLNALYGVKERIIGPPDCLEAFAGERWVRTVPSWTAAPAGASYQYPQGYTPDLPSPIDDFNAKFVSATYVTDVGTRQERWRTFGREVLRTGFTGPDGLPYTSLVSPPMDPLGVGAHTTTVLLTMSAEHCDGLAPDAADDCLPEGTFPYTLDTPIRFLARSAPAPGPGQPTSHPKPTAHKPKATARKPVRPARSARGR